MGVIVLHNGNMSINICRGCVSCASFSQYKELYEVMVVLPPLMDKRQTVQLKNHNRISSQCEGLIQKKCSRCQMIGHTSRNCDTSFPAESTKSESSSRTKSSGKSTVKSKSWHTSQKGSQQYDVVDLKKPQ